MAIGTPLGPDALLLTRFSIRERISAPFEIEAELASEDRDLDFNQIVGHSATIRFELGKNKGTRYFNGYVSRLVQTNHNGRYARYRATILPWLWFLTRTSDCRVFQRKSALDIAEEVFNGHRFGSDCYALETSGKYPKRRYCVQYRETDFNLVSRLLESEGVYYWFEHGNGRHKLVMADRVGASKPAKGYETIDYHEVEQGSEAGREAVTLWAVEKELQPVQYDLKDFDFKKPGDALKGSDEVAREHGMARFGLFDYPGEYFEAGDADRYAKVRLEELQARHELVRGVTTAMGLTAGGVFELRQHPQSSQNRKYLITELQLAADAGEFDSGGGGGRFFTCNFTAIPASSPFRPPRVTPKPVIQGPQTAIVVGTKGEEIDTDKHGRVKVQFHWDRYGKADENSSCWVRVSQGWAGKNWGAFYLPRIGQEVIVEFLEGDPDRPIVTGRVYNADVPPPYDLPAEKTKSTLKSNSTKGGDGFNEIRFEDKKDKEQIFVHGQKNLDVRVRNDVRETNYGNRDVRVGWEKDGKSGGDLNTLIRKDVNTHVEGTQYELVEKKLHQTVQEDVAEDHQKNHATMVGKNYTLNAKEIVIEGAQLISEKAAKVTIEGAQGVHAKGGMVCVEGSTGVSLKVGGNFVSITPAGVAISGTLILLNSGGAALPVEPAKPVPSMTIDEPLEAKVADDGKTGKKTVAKAAPARRKSRTVNPVKAPSFVPPPPGTGGQPSGDLGPTATGGGSTTPEQQFPPGTKCVLKEIKARCEHNRTSSSPTDKHADGRRILEVVPGALGERGADSVSLEAIVESPCGEHLVWSVSDHGPLKGAKVQMQARATLSDSLWIPNLPPRVYSVSCPCCHEAVSSELEVRCFPPTKLKLEFDSSKLGSGKCAELVDSIRYWEAGFGALLSRFSDKPVKTSRSVFDWLPKLKLEAYWKEWRDWRTFYCVDINFEWTLTGIKIDIFVSFIAIRNVLGRVPAIGDWLGKVADALLKVGLQLIFELALKVNLIGQRNGPDEPLYSLAGKLQGRASAKAKVQLVGDVLGGDIIRIALAGSTEANMGFECSMDDQGIRVKPIIEWKGFVASLTVEALWGLLSPTAWEVPLVEKAEWPDLKPITLYQPGSS